MVFFCCNGCGESLKKQKVEQHSYSCRSYTSVSCIDCNVTFTGSEYKKHTSCLTEAQRYQGHLYQEKENKGAIKQGSWMETVRNAAETCKNNAALKGLLVRIAENDNVPRKRGKFLNFIKNSMRVGNMNLVEQAWKAIEEAKETLQTSEEAQKDKDISVKELTINGDASELENKSKKKKKTKSKKATNENNTQDLPSETTKGTENLDITNDKNVKTKRKRVNSNSNEPCESEIKKKKKKIKNENGSASPAPNMNHANEVQPETPGKKYKITSHIQQLVFEKEEISLKKLKRKVTAAYLERYPHKSGEEASRLFEKKVKNVPGVAVEHGSAIKEILDTVDD